MLRDTTYLFSTPILPRRRMTSNDSTSAESGTLDGELDERAGAPPPGSIDRPRIERAVREILAAVGEDPDREGLRETPDRVARMYAELFSGLSSNPAVHLE